MKIGKRNILLQIIVMIVLLILVIGITYTCFKSKNKKLNIQNISNGALSIMLENENGEYEKNERTTWPTEAEGYYFSYSLSYCENGSTLSWEDNKVRIKTAGSDKCYAYFSHTKEEPPIDPSDPNDPSTSGSGSSNPQERLLADQDQMIPVHYDSLFYHDANLPNSAKDESYRYSGASDEVPNYVCLDNVTEVTEETQKCTTDEDLYRIIGLFKNNNEKSEDFGKYEMKLIKSDYATTAQLGTGGASSGNTYSSTSDKQYYKGELSSIPRYYWTSSGNSANKWKGSALNITNLNTNFKNYLKQQKPGILDHIEPYKWITAGNTWTKIATEQTVVTAYKNEITSPSRGSYATAEDDTYEAQIGLMYVSDYGYAAYQTAWTSKTLDRYNDTTTKNNNWMYMGLYEWTITRSADTSNTAFAVSNDGHVTGIRVYRWDYEGNGSYGVRPSFYLKSSTKIASGSGRKENPYRISW